MASKVETEKNSDGKEVEEREGMVILFRASR